MGCPKLYYPREEGLEKSTVIFWEALEKKASRRKICLKAYRYGFNGKEKDDKGEFGSQATYDYGFRIYNPGIGKFLSVDPLSGNYPYYTPYQFAGNKPIMFIDLDGAEFQIPEIEKFKYGNNVLLTPITVVDNSAINVLNGGIGILNSGIFTVHKIFTDPASLPEQLKSESQAMITETGKYLQGQYKYVTQTPIKKQIRDTGESFKNPENYEGPTEILGALLLTKYFKTPSTALNKNFPSIKTPYGDAFQDTSPNALAARAEVESGTKLYRIGTLDKSQAGEAQFWALENPLADPKAFSKKYGIPTENIINADFIEVGTLKPGTSFITRPAPAAPGNPAGYGGGIEVVTPSNGVVLENFNVIKSE